MPLMFKEWLSSVLMGCSFIKLGESTVSRLPFSVIARAHCIQFLFFSGVFWSSDQFAWNFSLGHIVHRQG